MLTTTTRSFAAPLILVAAALLFSPMGLFSQCTQTFNPLTGQFNCSSAGLPGPTGPAGPAGPAGVDGAPGVPGYSPNSLLSGGGVVWTGGLNFTISAATYFINGVQFTSPQTNITLTTANGSNDRIDVILVNASGAATFISGTAAATPLPPSVDPSTQLQLTFVYIPATSTTPANVTTTADIYHENTEWTTTRSGTTITLASTNFPHAGTVDLEGTNVAVGNSVTLTNGSNIDLANSTNLVFYIRSKATWASTRSLQLQYLAATVAKGSIVTLREGQFGFSSSNTTTYQQIVIPTSLFAINGTSVNALRISAAGSGANIGFFIDDIILQGGIAPAGSGAYMSWLGTWNSTTAYPANAVVLSSGVSYVALSQNTNKTPASNSTIWTALSTAGTTVSATSPYITVAGVKYLSSNMYPVTTPSMAGWSVLASATNITIGSTANGYMFVENTTASPAIQPWVWSGTLTAFTSMETIAHHLQWRIDNGEHGDMLGVYVWDSANSTIWGVVQHIGFAEQWNVESFTWNGTTSANPSAATSRLVMKAGHFTGVRLPVVQINLNAGAKTITVNVSMDGGTKYETVFTSAAQTNTPSFTGILGTVDSGTLSIYSLKTT